MRIISGVDRGRRLKSVKGRSVRPTSGRGRTVLFDILAPRIAGCRFLDLYAGVGAVGLEALSRGAEWVSFVEGSRKACEVLRQNIENLGMMDRAEVVCRRVQPALRLVGDGGRRFDLAFLDPPYDEEKEAFAALEQLGQVGLLDDAGVAVLQHSFKTEPPAAAGALALSDVRRVGDTCFSFFEARPAGRA